MKRIRTDDWAWGVGRFNFTSGVVKSRVAGLMSILRALAWEARPS